MEEINNIIDDYFFYLELPPTPTVYDHLLLSLRETDLIATFNWDPFLIQAYLRNQKFAKLPMMSFLHGNVLAGYCVEHKTRGGIGDACPKCKKRFTLSPLLYPITNKDYSANQFIEGEWRRLRKCLQMAFMVTVFGYSAPKSDTEALSIMKTSWGNIEKRAMEQIEIISHQHTGESQIDFNGRLNNAFKMFIHTHHYEAKNNFYDSWIANHPRRTGEAWMNQYRDAKFISDNPIPKNKDFSDLWEWLKPLREVENKAKPSNGE